MKVLGLIMEANPFHNGHQYFIEQARKLVNPDVTIVASSTYFTMRGEISVLNKYQKTLCYLNAEVDLVVEIPTVKVLHSASYFAKAAVDILHACGVTDLAFGLETDDFSCFHQLLTITKDPLFQTKLQEAKKAYTSPKKAYETAFTNINIPQHLIELFLKPNCTLAIQYCQAINDCGYKIALHPIARIASQYDDTTFSHPTVASATAIRTQFYNAFPVDNYLNYSPSKLVKTPLYVIEDKIFNLVRYQLTIRQPIYSNIQSFEEGIENYILQKIDKASSYQQLLTMLKNKRYTTSRFRRLFLNLILECQYTSDLHLRILGFNQTGRQYIKHKDSEFKNRLTLSPKKDNSLTLQLELKAASLYDLLTGEKTFKDEFIFPIKKGIVTNE